MENLKLEHLATFLEVVERGTFTAAAAHLGLTQPAVSLHIQSLERSLNVRLIERVGKKAMPTMAGADLLEHARRISGNIAEATASMAQHASGALGRVRIGTGDTACIFLLPAVLRDLRQRFPTLEITVKTGNSPAILQALDDNLLDLALVTLPAPGRMFDVTPVLTDPFVAISPVEDDGLPDIVRPADLTGRPVILYEAGSNTRRLVDQWLVRAGVTITPVMDLSSVEAIKELVGAGLGCAILPGTSVRDLATRGGIKQHTLSPDLHRQLAIVMRRDKVRNKGIRETIKALGVLG